ncbi:hypothetical protein [Streptomyces minutiscleroticus]|uniref:hypothetical protein n=1 Tax=Streptomyces minutiscleroticus TaxID=68238 RepID=UPI00167CB64B|nr:hypothetical protein [Streptomyces minutiscleroticus]
MQEGILASLIPPALKAALNELRRVRSLKPTEGDWATYADWRDQMAVVLDSLAANLLHETDQQQARAEAEAAREQARAIRARHPT